MALPGTLRRFLFLSFISEHVIEHDRDQLSLSIETRYALGALGGASSNNPPRIADQGVVANPMKSPEAPSSSTKYPSKCSVSSLEVVHQFHGHGSSLLPFLAIIKADLDCLQPELESPSFEFAMSTEEESLANIMGDTDEFGVRPCCLLSQLPPNETSFADIINPTSSSASRTVELLAGLQDRQMQMYVVEK
jgi:hypothetical protein